MSITTDGTFLHTETREGGERRGRQRWRGSKRGRKRKHDRRGGGETETFFMREKEMRGIEKEGDERGRSKRRRERARELGWREGKREEGEKEGERKRKDDRGWGGSGVVIKTSCLDWGGDRGR